MKRQIIKIDEDKCTGCGLCIPNCNEGALQVIDGKARLISDLFCDGLGACIGYCPESAIEIEEREAVAYDENKVMEVIVKQGHGTIKAHLKHLKEHNQTSYFNEAIEYINKNNIKIENMETEKKEGCSCPGSKSMYFSKISTEPNNTSTNSELTHWPIQLHLINPESNIFDNSDLIIAADCTAFSYSNFHTDLLKGKKLIIACPKLDTGKDIDVEKISKLISNAKVNTITVAIMEVPCCNGLLFIVKEALAKSERKVPIKLIVISIQGKIINEEWI